jgi:hypothetical protein
MLCGLSEVMMSTQGFLVDKSNHLRIACEVAVVRAHFRLVRHQHALSAPVELLEEFKYVFCYTIVLPSFFFSFVISLSVCQSLSLDLLLPACIL